jgi:hypothetical protein
MSRPLRDIYRQKLSRMLIKRGRSDRAGRGRTLLAKEIGVSEATLARAVRGDKLRPETADNIELRIVNLPI